MRKLLPVLIFFTLPCCYGGAPEAESPDDATSEESSDGDEDMASDDSEDSGSDDEASDESSDEGSDEGDSEEKSSGPSAGSAKRLLTQEGTSFIHSFKNSEAGEKADERCEKASGGDAEKKAKCLAKATPKTTSGIRFVKDGDTWWFVRFEVKNNKPIDYNRVQAEFGEESGSKITIKTTGPDKGKGGKGAVPASFEIEVPNDYSIVIVEPGRGKTVYETKLGLFDEKN